MGPKSIRSRRTPPKNIPPVRPSNKLKKRLLLGLAAVVFVVGLITVVQKVISIVPHLLPAKSAKSSNIKTSEVLDIKKADFAYMVPGKDDAWEFDSASPAFDKSTGVVKYNVKLKYSGVSVTFSQQKLPDELKPRGSNKFQAFINSANPARSQDVGKGTVYFLSALQNGAPANGADTVIYATDDILMFGKTGQVVGYDAWSKLLGTMKPH